MLVSLWIKSVHNPFISKFFFSCSFIIILDVFSFGFQSQVFWELTFSVQDLRVEISDVELESLTAQGKVLYL